MNKILMFAVLVLAFTITVPSVAFSSEEEASFVQVAAVATQEAKPESYLLSSDKQSGALAGEWESKVGDWGGKMKIAINSNDSGPKFSGSLQFLNSSCWRPTPFEGTVSPTGDVSITAQLGGKCGALTITGTSTADGRKWEYEAEYPDNGTMTFN